jgi:mono/diheme cytochrome c family protein
MMRAFVGIWHAFRLGAISSERHRRGRRRTRAAAVRGQRAGRRTMAFTATIGATLLLAGCGSQAADPSGGDTSAGKVTFERSCAMCHGMGAVGTDKGPPFVDKVYEPSHHGDGAFLFAVRQGVSEHHWNFGDMPAIPDVSDEEVTDIVAYVRGLQAAAGIK